MDLWLHPYTRRQQAIDDGALVDVSNMARQSGIRFPVAVSQKLWAEYLSSVIQGSGESNQTRLRDVITLFALNVRLGRMRSGELQYSVYTTMPDHEPLRFDLKAIIEPGDLGEPVITIMLLDESWHWHDLSLRRTVIDVSNKEQPLGICQD